MAKLTEKEWEKVFRLRVRSKRGKLLESNEHALVEAAYDEDRERYAAMAGRVFNATVPAGSTKRVPE